MVVVFSRPQASGSLGRSSSIRSCTIYNSCGLLRSLLFTGWLGRGPCDGCPVCLFVALFAMCCILDLDQLYDTLNRMCLWQTGLIEPDGPFDRCPFVQSSCLLLELDGPFVFMRLMVAMHQVIDDVNLQINSSLGEVHPAKDACRGGEHAVSCSQACTFDEEICQNGTPRP